MTNKKSMVKHLNRLLPHLLLTETTATDPISGVNTTRIKLNKDGDTHLWYDIALDEDTWEDHIDKLRYPGLEHPPRQHRQRRGRRN